MSYTGWVRIAVVLFALTFIERDNARAENRGYTFSINGQPVQPVHYSRNSDADTFAPGDVIYVGDRQFDYGGLYMTLGEERDCRFVTTSGRTSDTQDSSTTARPSPRDSRVFLELPDGRRQIVGLKVSWTIRQKPIDPQEQVQGKSPGPAKPASSERISYNPLEGLSPEEIHGLWGIALIQWPQGIEQQLAHVNTERVCFTVDDGAGVGGRTPSFFGGPVFPPLPAKTRYLVVEESLSPGLRDFSHFRQFHDLVVLQFESFPSEPLDAGLICQNAGLRYLDLSGCGIPNYAKLAALTELRFLNLARCRDIDNLDFIKDMRQLGTLLVGWTRISSLSPLDGSPSICQIHAGMSSVRILPQGDLPALKAINVMSSKLDRQAVTQFRQDHPACVVEYGWVDSLRHALQETTRLRIRSGGTCHRRPEEEKTLVEITDGATTNRVVDAIDIDESRSGGACMCCGNPTFEFYASDRLLAMVGYHHGERLRWAGGNWTGDGELTRASQDFLIAWLDQHGVQGPRREVEGRQRQKDEDARREKRYTELIPPQTLSIVMEALSEASRSGDPRGEKRPKLMAEAFMKHEKDRQTSMELYLRVFGVTANGAWNTYYFHEETISKCLLPRFKGPELAQAATTVAKDDEGMIGAARWFFGEDGWRNLDESDRQRVLPPLAQRALQHRYMDTRKRVMNVLSEFNSPWAAESLRQMLSRPTDPNWSPPKFKPQYGWKIALPGGDQVYADECSDAVWAAFCLAKMRHVENREAIQKLADASPERDKALLQKALQLLSTTP